MPRLFVDVDQTVLDKGRWMGNVVDAVRRFHQWHPDWSVIIWSRAGAAHARMAAAHVLPGASAIAKKHRLLRPDDIVVDNNRYEVPDWRVPRRLYSPSEFARIALNGVNR